MRQSNHYELEPGPRCNAQLEVRLSVMILLIVFSIMLLAPRYVSAYQLEQVQPSPTGVPGVWEIAPLPTTGQYDFVEFVGEQGWAFGYHHYAHWDGNAWTTYPLAEHRQGGVIGMKSLSANDIWLVRRSAVFHWNGIEWQMADVPFGRLDAAYGDELNGIDFASPTLGWLVGAELDEKAGKSYGLLFHWNGQRWTQQKFNDIPGLTAIDMVSETDGWMVSFDGGMFHWNGKTWDHFEVPDIDKLMNDFAHSGSSGMRISMTSATDGWMIGGRALWHWDGQQWREFQHARLDLNDIAMVSPNFGWAVGGTWKTNDHLLLFWDGQQWTEQFIAADSPLILVRANTLTDGWLLAYNKQTGEGPETLYRYRPAPPPTATPLPTLTWPPLPTLTQTTPPPEKPTSSLTATTMPSPSSTIQSPDTEDSLTNITNWIITISFVIVVGGGVAMFLYQRRISRR